MINFLNITYLSISICFGVLTDDTVVTSLNSRYEFNMGNVDCIGCIRVDDDFIIHATHHFGMSIIHGQNLQRFLIEHLENICNLEQGTAMYTKACNLVYNNAQSPETVFIDINNIGEYLYNQDT